MLKYWTVCSPSTTSPGNGSSKLVSGSSMSIGVSMSVPVRSLVVQQCPMSRNRARQLRAKARAARETKAAPQLGGPSRPTLRWPLVLQTSSGAATSLGEKKRGQQGSRRTIERKTRPLGQTTRLGTRWDQNSVTAATACLHMSQDGRTRFRRDLSLYISVRTVPFPREVPFHPDFKWHRIF